MDNFDILLFTIECGIAVTYWLWLSYKNKKELKELDERLKRF